MAIEYPGIEHGGYRYMIEFYGNDECFRWAENIATGECTSLRIRDGRITQEVFEAAVELGFPSNGPGRWDTKDLLAHYQKKLAATPLTGA